MDERRASAVLAALAVGDALGLPLEVQGAAPRGDWLRGLDGLQGIVLGGRMVYSDDTEVTLILAESIAENCGFNPQAFAELLARRARTWDPVRNYGVGVSEVIEAVRRGVDWRVAARRAWGGRGSFGNNAAVRSPPIAIFYTLRESVEAMAVAQAMVTHVHPIGVEGARLAALAVHLLAGGLDPSELPRVLARETVLEDYRERLELIPELLGATPERVARVLGNGGAAHETVPAAIYALVAGEGVLERVVAAALSLGGDADSIAALAAALAAAHDPSGVEAPSIQRLLSILEDAGEIMELGARLVRARERCGAF